MKTTANQSSKATAALYERAVKTGIKAEILERSKPARRRYSALGSTHAPQKVIILNGIRMSLGQAKQYIAAREA